ncbi:MAG TPA: hypothetical protein VIW80_04835 [Pyrinomonadaceae bacterium]
MVKIRLELLKVDRVAVGNPVVIDRIEIGDEAPQGFIYTHLFCP